VYTTSQCNIVTMMKRMESLFHGTGKPGSIANATLCVEGKSQFSHLWDRSEIDSGITKLQLKQSIVRNGLSLSSDIAFPKEIVCRATLSGATSLIGGRQLMACSILSLQNLKKAFAFAKEFLDADMNYPSSTTESDLDDYVLKKM
jgi:hypothetical protein